MKKYICGVDEAGRGAIAGDVYAAAVILDDNILIDGIMDSKVLTANQRSKLYTLIIDNCIAYGIGVATVNEIAKFNILNASMLAMKRAVLITINQILKKVFLNENSDTHLNSNDNNDNNDNHDILSNIIDAILIDGNVAPYFDIIDHNVIDNLEQIQNHNYLLDNNNHNNNIFKHLNCYNNELLNKLSRPIIKGDVNVMQISAASILAKVARDNYMIQLDTKYPDYQFIKHKGYYTKLHKEKIQQYGVLTKLHRASFAPVRQCLTPELPLLF